MSRLSQRGQGIDLSGFLSTVFSSEPLLSLGSSSLLGEIDDDVVASVNVSSSVGFVDSFSSCLLLVHSDDKSC